MKVRLSSLRVMIWVVLIWLFVAHIVLWRGQSWIGLKLQARTSLGLGSGSDWLNKGHLCRHLKRFDCAFNSYAEFLKLYPEDTEALGFAAMSLAEQSLCDDAEPYFDRYFRGDGDSAEVWYYLGKCRDQDQDDANARLAYYRAALRAPHSEIIIDRLVEFLSREGRFEEALSALASVTEGEPHKSEIYRRRYLSLQQQVKTHSERKNAIRLPGLKSINFFSPIRLSSDSEMEFFIVAPEETTLKVYGPTLSRLLPGDSKASLDQVQLGPWVLSDVQAEAQTERIGRVGRSALDRFEVYEEIEAGVRFLVIYAH